MTQEGGGKVEGWAEDSGFGGMGWKNNYYGGRLLFSNSIDHSFYNWSIIHQ